VLLGCTIVACPASGADGDPDHDAHGGFRAGTGVFVSGAGGPGPLESGRGSIDLAAGPGLTPADIIIIFDTSSSMALEANAVETNINANFAQILCDGGLDYRVVVVADYGTASTDLCIEPPLGGATDCSGSPAAVPGQFYHYHDQGDGVGITPDSFLEALEPHSGDDDGNYVTGILELLRTDSIKHILFVSDDDPQGSTWGVTQNPLFSGPTGLNAAVFFNTLLDISPTHFGSPSDPRVVFHAIVGVEEKPGAPNKPYGPTELISTPNGNAVQSGVCLVASDPGVWFQMLAVATDGLRYPVCNTDNYGPMFQRIAAEVLQRSTTDILFADGFE
jgi:hypothetical protein